MVVVVDACCAVFEYVQQCERVYQGNVDNMWGVGTVPQKGQQQQQKFDDLMEGKTGYWFACEQRRGEKKVGTGVSSFFRVRKERGRFCGENAGRGIGRCGTKGESAVVVGV